MKQITPLTVEHCVVTSTRSYQAVIAALEAQLGQRVDWESLPKVLAAAKVTAEQAVLFAEQVIGTSGFTIFGKVEAGVLLALQGIPRCTTQYAIGNPLLATQMIAHAPEVALYAPLHIAVYENAASQTVVAYERFTSQLAQYPHPAIVTVAQQVEQKVDALVAAATGEE